MYAIYIALCKFDLKLRRRRKSAKYLLLVITPWTVFTISLARKTWRGYFLKLAGFNYWVERKWLCLGLLNVREMKCGAERNGGVADAIHRDKKL